MMLERGKYYTNDDEGCIYYCISRAYNDLFLNNMLLKSVSKNKNDIISNSVLLYLYKLKASHLKEILKLIYKIKTFYPSIMTEWEKNAEVKKIMTEIIDEIKKPVDAPNSINAKYLEMRNNVFHYLISNDDIEEFKKINLKLCNFQVDIELDENGKYKIEKGADLPLLYDKLNSKEGFDAVDELAEKILIMLREVLTDHYNAFI